MRFTIFTKTILLSLVVAFSLTVGFAQERGDGKEDLPDGIKETLAKRRIKAEEKEFEDLIKRTEEAVKLSDELVKAYSETNQFTGEDTKKLEKLEKVVKKIRGDLGAEDDDKTEDKPSSLITTLADLKDKTSSLLKELKKTGRYSISVVAVESSNTILKLVRFLRLSRK